MISSSFIVTLGALRIDVLGARAFWQGNQLEMNRLHALVLSHLALAGTSGKSTTAIAEVLRGAGIENPARQVSRVIHEINRWSLRHLHGKLCVMLDDTRWFLHGNCGEIAEVQRR